jgi:hypothetical protein
MAKKPAKNSDSTKPSTRAKRVKAADTVLPEAEPVVASASAEPSYDEIRDRAYQIFRKGINLSDPVADWFQAEKELKAELRH